MFLNFLHIFLLFLQTNTHLNGRKSILFQEKSFLFQEKSYLFTIPYAFSLNHMTFHYQTHNLSLTPLQFYKYLPFDYPFSHFRFQHIKYNIFFWFYVFFIALYIYTNTLTPFHFSILLLFLFLIFLFTLLSPSRITLLLLPISLSCNTILHLFHFFTTTTSLHHG